jgi:hypothetical protein
MPHPDTLHIPARGLYVGRYPPQPVSVPDQPLPCHSPSYWLRLFSSQIFPYDKPTFLKPSQFYTHLPACEDGTECSETSAYKIDAGELPRRKHATFKTRRKFEIKKTKVVLTSPPPYPSLSGTYSIRPYQVPSDAFRPPFTDNM